MTRKSNNRLQRDGVPVPAMRQPKLRLWDEVENLRVEATKVLGNSSLVAPILRSEELVVAAAKTGKLEELKSSARLLATDTVTYSERLKEIGKQHEGRKGAARGTDDMMAAIAVGEQYRDFIMSYNQVVLPTIREITEIAEGATELRVQEATEAQAAPEAEEATA